MFSVSFRDLIFVLSSFVLSFLAISQLISTFGGAALGAPTIVELANSFLLIGVSITTLIAFLSTRWVRRSGQNAAKGAVAGASTVIFSVLIGMLIFYVSAGHNLFLVDLLIMTIASLAIIPVGVIAGVMIYGIRQK